MRAVLSVLVVFPAAPPTGLASLFHTIIDRLCRALARQAERDWTATVFVSLMVQNLRRRFDRFVALKRLFDAGVPPPPRRVRERTARDTEYERPFDFVPGNRGWLLKSTERDGAASFGQLCDLLAEPEMAAFIAADPRVGRLLRPLWRMLSVKRGLPEVLQLPPRPRASVAPAAMRERALPADAAPTPRAPRRYRSRPVRFRSGSPIPA